MSADSSDGRQQDDSPADVEIQTRGRTCHREVLERLLIYEKSREKLISTLKSLIQCLRKVQHDINAKKK